MGRDYLRLDTLKKKLVKRACWRSDSDLYETFTYSKERVKPIPLAWHTEQNWRKLVQKLLGHRVGSGIRAGLLVQKSKSQAFTVCLAITEQAYAKETRFTD